MSVKWTQPARRYQRRVIRVSKVVAPLIQTVSRVNGLVSANVLVTLTTKAPVTHMYCIICQCSCPIVPVLPS